MPAFPATVLSVLLLALAACAGGGPTGPWQKPGMTEEQKAQDMFACRDYARERVNSRAVRQTEGMHSRAVAAQDVTRNDEMAALRRMQEHDHMKLERRFFDECMRANGYRRFNEG